MNKGTSQQRPFNLSRDDLEGLINSGRRLGELKCYAVRLLRHADNNITVINVYFFDSIVRQRFNNYGLARN